MAKTEQTVDLLISHSQVLVRSQKYDEDLSQWGKGNIVQGAVLHRNYAIFDPLPDDAFGAKVHLKLSDEFVIDEQSARCIVAPFHIQDPKSVEVASATEKFKVDLDFEHDSYSLYYEICEGDEVFYKFTFVPSSEFSSARYIKDDPWGGEKDKELVLGKFD
jgi:hypothetical protein